MGRCCGVKQLCSHPHLVALALNRAGHHIADIEAPADLADINRAAPIDGSRIAVDHGKVAETGEVRDDVCGETIGKPSGRLIARDVIERQYRDCGFSRRLWSAGPKQMGDATEEP
ncbi:hypothetical protein MAE02_54620 [Microvirga aerophila]|uniref:Uncharacterized protein n=1 Tax=Microvirga aerophila TaxID=670291 RepID=A0A512C0M5_9HYPH|nr:hypothetical protein MAE02_54620 [Microvirga aerophila]